MSDDLAEQPIFGSHVTLHVCTTCRREGDAEDAPRAGAGLAEAAMAAAPPGVTVVPVKCLAACKRGPAAALSRPGAWSYVIGGLCMEEAVPALMEGARLYAGDPGGLLPWRGRPEPLKRGLIARLPPMPLPETAP
jgi:predicted metal-binding protein